MSDEHRTLKSKPKKKETKVAVNPADILGTGLEQQHQEQTVKQKDKSYVLIISGSGSLTKIVVFSSKASAELIAKRLQIRGLCVETEIVEVEGIVNV